MVINIPRGAMPKLRQKLVDIGRLPPLPQESTAPTTQKALAKNIAMRAAMALKRKMR